jgi:4-amino-4-deoxy-L-arabinose transferase-like glycosyltransferase
MKLAAPALLLLGAATAVAAWLTGSDDVELRRQLTRWQFWMLEAQCALLVVSSWLNVPRLIRSLQLGRPAVLAAAGAAGLALVLAAGVAPRTNRIYYDEHIYEGVAQNLSDLHLAQMCNEGNVEYGSLECRRGQYNKEPYGYPYLVSLGYRLFGVREPIAHQLNALCAALLVCVVFLAGCALFEDWQAGALAALVMALIPQHVLWSHSAAAESSAALMSALAVLAAIHHVRERSTRSALWTVAATVFAVQFRPESVLLVPFVGLVVSLRTPGELGRARTWWAAALGLGLCTLSVAHFAAVRGDGWGAAGPAFSFRHLSANLPVNGRYYLDGRRFPIPCTALALFGLMARPIRRALLPAAWFLLFFGVFLFFYAGSYDFGADVRFSLLSHAPLALLAGRGGSWLLGVAERSGASRRRASMAIGALLACSFLWYIPQVRAVGEESWAARADVAFAERVIPGLPGNSIVLTHNPSIFLLNGVSAGQMSLVTDDPEYVARTLSSRYAGGVFLHWNAWCGWDNGVQRRFCENALRSFSSDLYQEHHEREFRYAFYRLQTASTVPKTAP